MEIPVLCAVTSFGFIIVAVVVSADTHGAPLSSAKPRALVLVVGDGRFVSFLVWPVLVVAVLASLLFFSHAATAGGGGGGATDVSEAFGPQKEKREVCFFPPPMVFTFMFAMTEKLAPRAGDAAPRVIVRSLRHNVGQMNGPFLFRTPSHPPTFRKTDS